MTDMRIIKKAADVFLEALFPSGIYCISCGSLITPDRPYSLCDRCIRQLHWITGRTCSICGKALQDTYRGSICYSCLTRSHDFDRGYSCLTYGMHERELIFGLKYNGRGYLGRILGDMIYDRISLENLSADVIIPVPVHRSRERHRGYNQAGIIADSLSEHAGIPADSRSLIRVRETQRLRGLDPLEREDVLEGAFAVRPDRRQADLSGGRYNDHRSDSRCMQQGTAWCRSVRGDIPVAGFGQQQASCGSRQTGRRHRDITGTNVNKNQVDCIYGPGLWLQGQASCGQKVPRKLIRKAAVIMAQFRSKSSGKSGSRQVWGQRPGQPDRIYSPFFVSG